VVDPKRPVTQHLKQAWRIATIEEEPAMVGVVDECHQRMAVQWASRRPTHHLPLWYHTVATIEEFKGE
jgi:hypothetical protein